MFSQFWEGMVLFQFKQQRKKRFGAKDYYMIFSDFVSAMEDFVKDDFERHYHFSMWRDSITDEEWQKFKDLPLTKGHVIGFAEVMAEATRQVLRDTCTDELYEMLLKDGHDFLYSLHRECVRLGIEVSPEEVNVPLTASDAIVRDRQRTVEGPERRN